MRVARINNGTVANVELWQDGATLPPDAIECGPEVGKGWTYAGGTFSAPPKPIEAVVLTPLEFLSRLTPQELGTIAALAQSDLTVEVWKMTMLAAGEIRSDDERTVQGLAFAVSKGILTQERAAEVMSNA
jgi:hypothetical protein